MLINSTSFAQDKPSIHGMLLFGQSKIYLSHLPMFHPPHDYQVIIEVELSAPAKEAYLSSFKNSDEKIYTLVPEVFILPAMIKNPKSFKAQLYKGHFERGGKVIAEEVAVNIKQVIYFKKFNPQDIKPENGNYILFGNEKEQFLAHLITTKPDFDQILKVDTNENIKNNFLLVVIPAIKNTEPLIAQNTYESVNFSIQTKASLYLERDDLSF